MGRGASVGAMFKACSFALVWSLAIGLLPRDQANEGWFTVGFYIVTGFFPIIVAVNMGYHEAHAERLIGPQLPVDQAAGTPMHGSATPNEAITAAPAAPSGPAANSALQGLYREGHPGEAT